MSKNKNKNQKHVEWLDDYWEKNNVEGDILEKSQEIANKCNKECKTEGSERGPKNRLIMTNGGIDAQTVARHMMECKKRAGNQPRAIRNTPEELKRLEAVSSQRIRPWVGDKMLLMEANNTTHDKVKNHFEERVRQKAKKAMKSGGKTLEDWKALARSQTGSNKYATKMWTEYNYDVGEYLRKLRNGLISLETGEEIKGDSSKHPSSALNPANGHLQNMIETSDGADQNAYSQPKHQAEDSVDQKRLSDTDGSVDSEMSFHNNYLGTDGSSENHFSKDTALYNDWFGAPQPKTNLLKGKTPKIQMRNEGKEDGIENYDGPASAFMQQSTNNVFHLQHSDAVEMSSQPRNRCGELSNVISDSLGEIGPQYRKKQKSAIFQAQMWGASRVGHEVLEDMFEYPDSSSNIVSISAAPPKKRKQVLLEEETFDVRPSKRQCQPERQFESEQQAVGEKEVEPQRQYNGPEVTDEGHELKLNNGVDFSSISMEDLDEWYTYDIEKVFAFPVQLDGVEFSSNGIEDGWEWFKYEVQPLSEHFIQPHNPGTLEQGKEFTAPNNVGYPGGNLRAGSMVDRENRPLYLSNILPGDTPQNAIVIPASDEEDETARSSRITHNETSLNGEQSTKAEDEPGYLARASSVKGYTNAWYYQGRLRTSDPPAENPLRFEKTMVTFSIERHQKNSLVSKSRRGHQLR
ncbi:hypothetical protein NHQ30_000703 [Ciborinia camelliae]|nr:hypothetical protein NHQ30_000703 [Ciborinia camelliae]